VISHDPRQHHTGDHGNEAESEVLLADYLVVEAEHILSYEACGLDQVMRSGWREFGQ
jgi:hypothetical protein